MTLAWPGRLAAKPKRTPILRRYLQTIGKDSSPTLNFPALAVAQHKENKAKLVSVLKAVAAPVGAKGRDSDFDQLELSWLHEDRTFRPYADRCPHHYEKPKLYRYFNKWKHRNFYQMACPHKDYPLSQVEWETDAKRCIAAWNMTCKLIKDR